MEVHHHPHVAKKNFKEYFLEFLMIFLAVTMGFFAEQIRESFVERSHEKEYIQSFYEDLQSDTAKISDIITFDQNKIDTFNTIAGCYDSVSKNIMNASCMLSLIKKSFTNLPFQMTDRTLKQLANAGGYRLLRKEDADSITKYQGAFNLLEDFQTTVFQEAQDNVRNTYNQVVNFRANVLMKQLKPGKGFGTSGKDKTSPLLFSDDKVLLNKYFNELLEYDKVTNVQQEKLKLLKDNQIRLINYFKNKYHFQ